MEKLRKAVSEIAYAQDHTKLSITHRSLIPLLSLSSYLYTVTLSLRHCLYHFGLFSKQRLAVPVISVGNLTWGGNGKTPMVEFIAQWFADSGITTLILTRGYAGGDEAKMLARHLFGKPAKIGIGANRAATAASFLKRYGYIDPHRYLFKETWAYHKVGGFDSGEIGPIVLDDGMQHWSLHRDLEIIMINALSPWGNCRLIPLGPLREPLTALRRADVAVLHHANLITEQNLKDIELMIREVKESLPIFFTGMIPSYFFEVGNINFRIPLGVILNAIVLCVSAIGSANAFVQGIEKMGAFYVDRIDFSDHHLFQTRDIEMIAMKLGVLEDKFGSKPVVVVTEKDYDRDPEILQHLSSFKVLVLCSELQIIPNRGQSQDSFIKLLKELLEVKWLCAKQNKPFIH
ncbi:probable tetraacyldisaccharide 4'-kinase, mitochondrial [Ricinus communis]|uniref:probable tetraacyldisaccharide 4'-kinase, mitochondrial n=1 Tax=Ricinus communis TaxID=3988 RepID=UPI000772C0A4|nr:probable tetraacyldisaccharide 4'-kinase, mitochondrial [Ricinus communis]|eukprot:XP_015581292.1 probable tetraacyldisaccharide 4'-kinase, mitochondrial [Ricinus communis]